ncbi:MAG TPA: LLM class flavin-dependent oxidoreductase [Acetobacteraceae bacterium]|jgi:alkanesulfonate monooxygenase SsuD/methylene tetrahydromethanopterin reductase-like flavin-dependent oxidoreductase (luciferase family)|nr:LLM class flavin-dependent oxidoreductase [Acetobacteraceae bacterium]
MSGERKRPLKVGLVLPTVGEWMAGATARWKDMVTIARHAEDIGFDSIWINDHLYFRWGAPHDPTRGTWECWSLLSAIAAITTRVEIGTLVVGTGFRNPALLAKAADAVDDISGGRLVLGLGAGYHEPEYRAFGYPYDHLVSRFEESLIIIHTLLREGNIDFNGKYHQARDCELVPRLSPRNGPPILMGPRPNSPRMLGLMAKYADYWTAVLVHDMETYQPMKEAVDAACLKAGRDPSTLMRTVMPSVNVPGLEASRDMTSWVRPFRLSYNRGDPLTGSVDAVSDQIRAFAAAGVSHMPVWLDPLSIQGIDGFARVLEALDRA